MFTWSPKDFPQADKMITALHDNGVRLVEIVDPGIKDDPAYATYRSGEQAGIFVREANGAELHARVWPGETAFPVPSLALPEPGRCPSRCSASPRAPSPPSPPGRPTPPV